VRVVPWTFPVLLLILLTAGATVVACGGSSGNGPVDLKHIPTATLPATLPDPVIVSGTPLPAGTQKYVVQSGDNPSSIAAHFGVSVEELMAANGITDPTSLHAGDELVIPGQRQVLGTTSTPRPTTRPTSTPRPTVSRTGGQTYVVQDGDIPETIAARFGITADALIAANGITDATSLQIGQELVIPTPQPTATPGQ